MRTFVGLTVRVLRSVSLPVITHKFSHIMSPSTQVPPAGFLIKFNF